MLDVRRDGPVCVLSFQREEKLNAISTAVERAMLEALAGPEVREARCVIFAGGERAFSAGADLKEERDEGTAGIDAYYRDTGGVYERIAALPQPTLSAIEGWCLGAGFELALATDFRIASETAVFGLPEVELGIVPSSGGTYRLVRTVGPARAKELLLLKARVDAAEAFRLGVVTEVVAPGEALPRALALARQVAELPPLAAAAAKQAANAIAESSREAGIMLERLAYAALAQTEESKAAGQAFNERGKS
ncbi:MAG TPA: enoyl-CoA hydratase/isomerase family protein [Gaiellaceae bacterium]|nr:enoyl-CoA hydratase/isomerase family protein [Gaiellaceae bacterium]